MAENYDHIRKGLKALSDQDQKRQVENQSLPAGEANSVIEAMDLTRKLAFHEQLQLVRLNTLLMESELAFPFSPEDVRRADPHECDVLIETEKVIAPPGSDHAMALIKSTRGISDEGLVLSGKFDSIFMTDQAYKERGAKVVVLTDEETELPKGEVQGRIHIPDEVLSEINEKLGELNRTPLSQDLASEQSQDQSDRVVGYDLVPEEGKGNEFFYKRGHIGLVLKLESGKSRIITKNALNERKEHGSVNLIRFTDGTYGMVNTVRMLVGAGASYRPEIGRGYADVMVDKYAKAIKEKYGRDMNPDQVEMELGLAVKNALRIETKQLRQDLAYEDVMPKLQIMDFDKDAVMKTAPSHIQHLMEEFEGLTPIKKSPEEVLKLMETGQMVDGFSMAVFASEFLNRGIVKINPRYADVGVALEIQSHPQLGKRLYYGVPQGPAFQKGMHTVGQIHPNTGNARFWYQARVTTDASVLKNGGLYANVPVKEVARRLADLEFSTVDAATLFRVLYSQRVIIPSN
ncbi:MAG: hypothetical protein ACHQUA_00980 [Microgenomates group bacterium]